MNIRIFIISQMQKNHIDEMNNAVIKYYDKNDVCRSHTARNEKDVFHVNPPNLKRKELEDAYYGLFENYQALKRTVNSQNEKIKILSTKLLRITNSQKNNSSKVNKCCIGNQNLLSEKIEIINDLQITNSKLTEKIKQLNMKLCSTKQFLKKSSNKCSKCALNRKASTSLLLTKRSDINLHKSAVSTQRNSVDRLDSVRSVETNTEYSVQFESPSDRRCNNNNCKTKLQEQQKKIDELQMKINTIDEKYLNEIGTLNENIDKLQKEKVVARSEQKILEEQYNEGKFVVKEMREKLLKTETDCYDLKTQLSIEQKKVSELETQVRTAHVSNDIVNVIDQYLCAQPKIDESKVSNILCSKCHKDVTSIQENNEEIISNKQTLNDSAFSDGIPNKWFSTPSKEDSGYVEGYKMMEETLKNVFNMNEELKQRVLTLEQQLHLYKVSSANQASKVLKQITEDVNKDKFGNDNDVGKILRFNSNDEENSDSNQVSSENIITLNHSSKVKDNNINNKSIDLESPREAKDKKNCKENEESYVINKNNDLIAENDKNTSYIIEKEIKNTKSGNSTAFYKKLDDITPKKYKSRIKLQKNVDIHKKVTKDIAEKISPVKKSDKDNEDKVKQKVNPIAKHELQNTYSIENKDAVTSLDNTEYDVSSITNESSNKKDVRSPSEPLSLGEDPGNSTESTTTTGEVSSSELGYLSEGELAVNKGPILSVGEKYIKTRKNNHQQHRNIVVEHTKSRKEMANETLEAIRAEIIRCQKLILYKPIQNIDSTKAK